MGSKWNQFTSNSTALQSSRILHHSLRHPLVYWSKPQTSKWSDMLMKRQLKWYRRTSTVIKCKTSNPTNLYEDKARKNIYSQWRISNLTCNQLRTILRKARQFSRVKRDAPCLTRHLVGDSLRTSSMRTSYHKYLQRKVQNLKACYQTILLTSSLLLSQALE